MPLTYVYGIRNYAKNRFGITYYVAKSGLLKKAQPKQSRMKSIMWHLRWLVRTRVNISLQPSGLIGPITDIKLRANWIGKVIQGLIQEQIYMQSFLNLNCHLVAFLVSKDHAKSSQMTI